MFNHLDAAIKEFLEDGQARGHSHNTTRAYGQALRDMQVFMAERQLCQLSELTPSVLRAYALHCTQLLSPGGAHARLRPVKTFLKWAKADNLVAIDLTVRLPMPKLPQEEQAAVRPDEFRKLLQAVKLSSRHPLRDAAILTVLFDTGLRASELTSLELDDIRPDGTLQVKRGKGGKERGVPVERSTIKVLRKYIVHERATDAHCQRIFLSGDEPMTRRTLDKLLERMCTVAALPRFSAHSFRRGFAVQFLRNGGDVFTLQRIFGHTNLEMSNRYAQMNRDDLKSVHRRASPLRRNYDD